MVIPSNHVCWYVNENCNYNCKFCYRYQEGESVLSFQEASRLIEHLSTLGINKITFSGEPLLVDWLTKIIALAKKKGMYTTVMTNGLLLTKPKLISWLGILNRLCLPVDGSTEEINYKMSRPLGHLKHVVEISQWFKKEPIKLKISTMISKLNYLDISAIALVVKKLKAQEWKIFQFRANRGDALINAKLYQISDENFTLSIESAKKSIKNTDIKFSFLSVKDCSQPFLLIKPNGFLEMGIGEDCYKLGNILKSNKEEIEKKYNKIA